MQYESLDCVDGFSVVRVRECRLQEQWADLQQIIEVAEQFNCEGEEDVFIAVKPSVWWSAVAASGLDVSHQFATEMMKDENLYVGSGGTGSLLAAPTSLDAELDEASYFHLNNLRVDDMQDILDFTLECSYIYPSLILSIKNVDLLIFIHFHQAWNLIA